MTSLVSLNPDSRTTSPARGSHLFTMSDGAIVAIWVEGRNGPGTDRVIRRYRSDDGGVTWFKLTDYQKTLNTFTAADGSKHIFPLFTQAPESFDTIFGFNVQPSANTSQAFSMGYDTGLKDFSDATPVTYTATNAWDALQAAGDAYENHDLGMAIDEYGRGHLHVAFGAYAAGAAYVYLIAIDAVMTKVTETRFTTSSPLYPHLVIEPPKTSGDTDSKLLYLTYLKGTNLFYRSFTYNGATYTAADAEETIPGNAGFFTSVHGCFLNLNGNLQVVNQDATDLVTRERTGVNTYSAPTTIGTGLPFGNSLVIDSSADSLAIVEAPYRRGPTNPAFEPTDDVYVFFKKGTTQARGELYYARRNLGVWGAQTAWKTGASGFNHPTSVIRDPYLDGGSGALRHKIHMLFSRGASIYPATWTLYYDSLWDGTPDAPTNVQPSTAGVVTATPTISATYNQKRAGDNLGKYRVRVKRTSDGVVFWDTGSGGTAWGGAAIAPGGTFSIVYAGTALVKGTNYDIEVQFWDSQESYKSPTALSQGVSVFTEYFTGTGNWTLVTGTSIGSVAANVLTAGNTGAWRIKADISRQDSRIFATFKADTTTGEWALERLIDVNNLVRVVQSNGTLLLQKVVAGVPTTVHSKTVTLTVNRWMWLDLERYGNRYVGRIYDTGVTTPGNPIFFGATKLVGVVTGLINDAAIQTGQIALFANNAAASQWGGISSGLGGAYAKELEGDVGATFAWNNPPSKAAASLLADPANGTQRVAIYPLAPGTNEKAIASVDLYRKLAAEVLYVARTSLGLTVPTTQTGFSAYRQLPEKIGRNLVPNGGFIAGSHGYTLVAGSTVVIDTASPTGYALRIVSTGAYPQNFTPIFPVEAGKAYSFAFQYRGDGTAIPELDAQWLDASGAVISTAVPFGTNASVYTEGTLNNQLAPGNARSIRIGVTTSSASGIVFITAIRMMQQAGAPAAWATAHQQYLTRGLAIYQASTNLAADGDMEAVGTASYAAVAATLTKDTVTFFAGAKSLKVASTGVDGRATQSGALGAGQPIAISVRAKGGDANCRLDVISTPSNASIGQMFNPNTTDWNTLRVTGVIAVGDTGYSVRLVAGANTVIAYFDNLAVENKAYDTMNADPSGQAFALAGRTASVVKIPTPASFDPTDFAVVTAYRADHASSVQQRYLWAISDAISTAFAGILGPANYAFKDRAGVIASASNGTAFAAGDTVVHGFRFRAGVGVALYLSINGGAVGQVTNVTPEAQIALSGLHSFFMLGSDLGEGGAQSADGTIGAFRILKGGLTDATISAFVSDPYQQPTANDLEVWQFEDFTGTVPNHVDRFAQLGKEYDYRLISRASAATPTEATGEATRGSVAASALDAWWLRDSADPTKDVQLYVAHDMGYSFSRGRPLSIAEPVQGGAKTGTYGAAPFGDEGSLRLIYPTAALRDATEAALKAFLATNNAMFLQDPFGGLRKVKISAPIRFDPELTPAVLGADLEFVEVR